MNLQPIRALALLAMCVLPSGCIIAIDGNSDAHWCWNDENAIKGSGVAKTETRAAQDFNRIEIACGADLALRIGPERSIQVTCDDNLLQYVRTEVEHGALRIELEKGAYSFRKNLRVEVTTPALESLSVSGSSDADLSGFAGGSLSIDVSGSGDVRASGSVEHLEVSISGSGDLDLYELSAQDARVSVSGSGDVELTAVRRLEADVSGSGDIRYRGTPETHLSVSGSGEIEQS